MYKDINSIYFQSESPDWNMFIKEGDIGRLAANRTVLCVMSEYGICNNEKMTVGKYQKFISDIQSVSGTENQEQKNKNNNKNKIIKLYF